MLPQAHNYSTKNINIGQGSRVTTHPSLARFLPVIEQGKTSKGHWVHQTKISCTKNY